MHRHARKSAVLALLLAACAGGDSATKDSPAGSGGAGQGDNESPGDGDSGDGDSAGDGDGSLPPEMEETVRFESPTPGKSCVYVPNPVTHRVAVVNAQTFAIESVRTGKMPTYVATVPGQDIALVLNVGSRDAALLRTVKGHTTAERLTVGHDANAIAIAPDGKHAVLYFDARASRALASTFQDITVVDLEEGKESSRGVSVGFHPRAVQFSADGKTAFVITDDGVSVVDLAAAVEGPTVAKLVSVGDTLKDPISTDVQVTRDGRFALARREGEGILRLVDLGSGEIRPLDLATVLANAPSEGDAGVGADAGADAGVDGGTSVTGPVVLTDVDLSADGSFALGVLRRQSTLVRIPIPEGFSDPAGIGTYAIEEQHVGSVSLSSTGKTAVLYTTAEPVEGMVVFDLDSGATRGVRLRKGVRAVVLSSGGERALVLHSAEEGDPDEPGLSEDERIDRTQGYSLVDTSTGFAKLKLTGASVDEQQILITGDASRVFALLHDEFSGLSAYETADLGSFEVETHSLSNAPSSIGFVPAADRVFIGQESEGGMISFIDAHTGEVVRPVAGFELVSGVQQ